MFLVLIRYGMDDIPAQFFETQTEAIRFIDGNLGTDDDGHEIVLPEMDDTYRKVMEIDDDEGLSTITTHPVSIYIVEYRDGVPVYASKYKGYDFI